MNKYSDKTGENSAICLEQELFMFDPHNDGKLFDLENLSFIAI